MRRLSRLLRPHALFRREQRMGFSFKDSVLVGQAANFSAVLAASPATYNQTSATAAAVTTAVDLYVDAYNTMVAARANGVRSEQQTATTHATRLEMLNLLRPIYSAVQDSVSISDAEKIALGVYVKAKKYTRQAAPDFAPLLSVAKVDGRVVTLTVRDPNEPDRKGRPPLVSGISVFSHVGAQAPVEASQFKFE